MTRHDINNKAKLLLDETEDKAGYLEPVFLNDLIDLVCDTLSRDGSVYAVRVIDLIAGQAVYPLPAFYSIQVIRATKTTIGIEVVLPQVSVWESDIYTQNRSCCGGWTARAIMQGVNTFKLEPTPTESYPGGLTIEGYVVPSQGSPSGTNMWPNMTDQCPLPARSHMAVAYGAAIERCRQFGTDPEYQARIELLQPMYDRLAAQVQADAMASNNSQSYEKSGNSVIGYGGGGSE